MSEASELSRSTALHRRGSAELRRDVLATLMPGFAGLTMPAWVAEAFGEGLISVCVYGENVHDATQLRALGAELRTACQGALIAIDEEGGEVTRLHYLEGSPYPGAAVMGRIDDIEYTELIGERVGRDILSAGFNLALGPIADVNSNPLNPVIGTRSFAADPELASRHVAAWTRGLQRTGALACAKHFPGHGDTAQDSHLALPTVDVPRSVLEARELPPFLNAVNAGVASIMTSHILLPQVDPSGPTTFSRLVLQGMLRDEMEFEGVIISDALDMKGACGEIGIPAAAVRALVAGCDLLCLGTSTGTELLEEIVATVIAAVEDGTLSEARLAEAAGRVRAASASMPPISTSSMSGASCVEPVETSETPAPAELARIAGSFDGLGAAREWLAAHPNASVLRVESEANMAVGYAPWGPFAAAADPLPHTQQQATAFAARPQGQLGDSRPAGAAPAGVIAIGRDMHRLPEARAAIDALRAAGTPILCIEMGWPGEGTAKSYADLSCYGSSRLVGAALLHLIEGESE